MRDLVIATWETDRERLERALPSELEPAVVAGRFLLSLAAFRVERGRAGGLPMLPYAQLNVRTYVTWQDEPAVFFIAARVTAGGLPGTVLGAPFRYARLRVEEGTVSAPGRGVLIRYRTGEPTTAGPLAQYELGLFENDGVRAFRVKRGDIAWHRAELLESARADFLFALGFEPHGRPELLYAPTSAFALEVPRRRISG